MHILRTGMHMVHRSISCLYHEIDRIEYMGMNNVHCY